MSILAWRFLRLCVCRLIDKDYDLNQKIPPGILLGLSCSSQGIKDSNAHNGIIFLVNPLAPGREVTIHKTRQHSLRHDKSRSTSTHPAERVVRATRRARLCARQYFKKCKAKHKTTERPSASHIPGSSNNNKTAWREANTRHTPRNAQLQHTTRAQATEPSRGRRPLSKTTQSSAAALLLLSRAEARCLRSRGTALSPTSPAHITETVGSRP